MTGSKPKIHECTVDGASITVETVEHEHGVSVVVTVPGMAPVEDSERTYPTEEAALAAGQRIARDLLFSGGG